MPKRKYRTRAEIEKEIWLELDKESQFRILAELLLDIRDLNYDLSLMMFKIIDENTINAVYEKLKEIQKALIR